MVYASSRKGCKVKLKIIKKPEYSAGKWRLVYEDGEDVYHAVTIQVDGKEVRYDGPFCSNTKEELIEKVLAEMVELSRKLREARLEAIRRPIA